MSSPHHGIFQFASPVFNKFQSIFSGWRVGDEDETFKSRAFTTLEKRLKKNNDGSYEKFNVALEQKSPTTPCVTIDRSQDGRLQVSHRKMLPHLMCCKIARWPDLQTHQELKAVDHCKFPGHQKQLSKVCINPYHYTRVDHTVYAPVFPPLPSHSTALLPASGNPIDYYSQTSMSPQSFNGSHASYVTAISPGAQSFESDTPPPGYHDSDMDVDNWFQLSNNNNMGENPFNTNSDTWCKITYWELSSRVGEPFTASSPSVIIDGFPEPTIPNQRFSLGSLSNINRNSVIETTRRAIKSGIKLERDGAKISAINLSEHPVFCQSRTGNYSHRLALLHVDKIDHGRSLDIFDFNKFEELVGMAMMSPGNNYERVSLLNSHCSVKISFVKGWGTERYQRQEVTSTPCWLDVTLYEPLAYLDKKLRELGSPSSQITSTS